MHDVKIYDASAQVSIDDVETSALGDGGYTRARDDEISVPKYVSSLIEIHEEQRKRKSWNVVQR